MDKRIFAVTAACIFMGGCSGGNGYFDEPVSKSDFLMDTYMTVTVYNGSSSAPEKALSRAGELEKKWSVTDSSSEIYAADHSGGKPVTLSEDTADLVSFALSMNEKTDGALDISLYPVLREWGFTTGEYRVPEDSRITELLESVGCEKLSLDGRDITVPDGMSIDLGSVGKGRAGDEMIKTLKENGVTAAMLDLGGNIQLLGSKPDGSDFRIAVRHPSGEGNLAKVEVSDCAVITSGGYERFFEQDGNIYWHILDPKTGCPAHSGVVSATVIGKSGTLCDALSTSLFVMGTERAADLWRASDDFDYILVTDDGRAVITEGIENSFTLYDEFSSMTVEVVRREK